MRGRKNFLALGLCGAAWMGCVERTDAQFKAMRVASGLSRPVFVTTPTGDLERIFIVEQRSGNTGRVRIVKDGNLLGVPFLSVSPVATGSEQGLLGLAFHPNYDQNGFFYINYNRADGDTVVARYTVSDDRDVADPNSAQTVIIIDQPFSNHNGGYIAFGPDGYLYIFMGDGGSANDPNGNAQNLNALLGKILRLDVDGDDFPEDPNVNYAIPADNPFVGQNGRDEIWAYGLRNPWRDDFDNLTGDLYIGDVGQNQIEEIDFQPANSQGGENYGWRCKEGTRCTGLSGCSCQDNTLIDPIYEYSHSDGCSVSGGVVYRGQDVPSLDGTYFFSDYCNSRVWAFEYDGQNVNNFRDVTDQLVSDVGSIDTVVSFGEDARGEVYICDLDGEVFKIIPDGVPCDAVKKFTSSCNNGKIKTIVKLKTNDYDGQNVTIAIDGNESDATISGNKAKSKVCCHDPGPHVVSLASPANCQDDLDVDC